MELRQKEDRLSKSLKILPSISKDSCFRLPFGKLIEKLKRKN